MKRLCPIETDSIHHIYSKSIHHFEIFNCHEEYQRMQQLIDFYSYDKNPLPFSRFIKEKISKNENFSAVLQHNRNNQRPLVKISAYCLMPTHVHFIVTQLENKGIEIFISRLFNAYTRYFNLRHNRRGPLWEHRFGNRLIIDDEHFQTAMNYVYYNPVEAGLVTIPSQWKYYYHLLNPGG